LGFLISIFELACTGQVYFPTIAYMVQGENRSLGYLLLAVYNFGFIVPLLAVFLLAYAGVGSERITKAFQKNLGAVKLGLAGLFVALAVLTVLQG
jgi:cytochrome c biogenesis protein CcdA